MMNKFILGAVLSFLFVGTASFAQAEDNAVTAPDVYGVRHFKNPEDLRTPETSYTYVRIGKSMASGYPEGNPNNQSTLMGSLGHRRLADSLIYGMEYTYHYMPNALRYSEYDIQVGYRPNLKTRVVPYIVGGAGLTYSNTGSDGVSGGSGINYFVDAGVELFKVDLQSFHVRMLGGVKYTKEVLEGAAPNVGFTDAYIGIGVGW